MATQSPEASEIRRRGRQRLIGAVAIALLLIVFVPMVLDSEPRPARQEPAMSIPPRDNPPALPAPPPAAAEAKPAEPEKAAPKVAVVQPKAAPTPTPGPAAAPKGPAVASPKEGFAVQVGAFADVDRVQQLRDRLAAAKITAYTEPAGSVTRVRVGPFANRDEAEKSAAAVRKIVPDAKVVSLP